MAKVHMSRSPYVQQLTLKMIIVGVFCLIGLSSCAPDVLSPIGKDTELGSLLSSMTEGYSVPVRVTDLPGPALMMSFSPAEEADQAALTKYLKLFDEEFSKHPNDLIQASGLKQVAIVKNLVVSGQYRAAMPDLGRKILFLDFLRGASNPTYQRHVIHHEFYHIIEPAMNGNNTWKDPQWAALNEEGFEYGSGGADMQSNSSSGVQNHPQPGFIDLYSTSGLEEDKAEIFGALFVASESAKMMEWAQTDEILANKIQYMKASLQQKAPDMDDAFWTKLNSENN
jgi:hypothetical protein